MMICSVCSKEKADCDPEWGICKECDDRYKAGKWGFERPKKPACMICHRKLIKDGKDYRGDCVHMRGKTFRWE